MKTKIFSILIFAAALLFFVLKLPAKQIPLEILAQRVINKCKNSNPTEICYNNEIPKLMKFLSMEETFAVTAIVQGKDNSFPYCHVLGHELSSIETKKNPDNWRDVVARCPSGVCSNGCVHGAFQEKYKDEVLNGTSFTEAKNEFKDLCEANSNLGLTGLTQGSCYHALGHLLMYVTGADINKTLATCDGVAKKSDGRDFRNLCYDGAFMQIFQPLDTDGKSLVRNFNLNKNNAWDFCKQFVSGRRDSCWQESWPIFLSELSNPMGSKNFCSKLDENSQEACYVDVFYIMPIQFGFNKSSITNYCSGFSEPLQKKCFAMTASRILEIDKRNGGEAVTFCNQLSDVNKSACFDQIVKDASFDFLPDSSEFANICSQLPSEWSVKCFKK